MLCLLGHFFRDLPSHLSSDLHQSSCPVVSQKSCVWVVEGIEGIGSDFYMQDAQIRETHFPVHTFATQVHANVVTSFIIFPFHALTSSRESSRGHANKASAMGMGESG